MTAEAHPDRAAELRAWRMRILASTWMAYAGLYFCRKPFYVAKKTLAEDLNLDVSQLGEIGTAYLIAYTIGQFMSAGLGQKRGARIVLLTGMAVSIGCNVAFAFANNYWTLFTFMFVNGLAQATGWPSVVGTIGRWTKRSERGTIMGFWGTCYQLGGVAATSWAGFWLVRTGVKGAFLAASMALFIAWIAVYFWQRNSPEDVGLPKIEDPADTAAEAAETETGTNHLWTRPLIINLALIGTCYFGIKFIRYALWSWTPFLLETHFGLEVDDAAYLSTLFDLCGFAGVVVAGVVSDRLFNGKRTLPSFIMLLGMMLGCAALGWFGSTSLFLFGACIGFIGFMLFGPDSLLSGAGAIDLGSPRIAVAVAGIINGTGSLGAVVQDLVVSRLLDPGSEMGAAFTAVWGASGAGVQDLVVALMEGAEKADMAPVFAVLWGASALSTLALFIMLIRARRGSTDL